MVNHRSRQREASKALEKMLVSPRKAISNIYCMANNTRNRKSGLCTSGRSSCDSDSASSFSSWCKTKPPSLSGTPRQAQINSTLLVSTAPIDDQRNIIFLFPRVQWQFNDTGDADDLDEEGKEHEEEGKERSEVPLRGGGIMTVKNNKCFADMGSSSVLLHSPFDSSSAAEETTDKDRPPICVAKTTRRARVKNKMKRARKMFRCMEFQSSLFSLAGSGGSTHQLALKRLAPSAPPSVMESSDEEGSSASFFFDSSIFE